MTALGQPDLYLGSTLVAGGTTSAVTALAGAKINWGNDSRLDFDPPATLKADLLVKSGTLPNVSPGTPVGLVDPASGRCLFAGHIATPTAGPDPSIKSALRISFTAASPSADLANHNVIGFDWSDIAAPGRYNHLEGSMPSGWDLQGSTGLTWIDSGRLKFQSKAWMELVDLFCRANLYRRHDTSTYVPGAGLVKRMNITPERNKGAADPYVAPTTNGNWSMGDGKPTAATGLAIIPPGLIHRDLEWEKSPDDTVTDVKVSTYGGAVIPADDDSKAFDYLMSAFVDNSALQAAYGFRQFSVDTDMSAGNVGAAAASIQNIVNFWLDADTQWRPTGLTIPDSRLVDPAVMLGLLAVDSRHMAALHVPEPAGVLVPGKIHSFVMAGEATWTGKKWSTDLTLGRTLD